MKFVVAFSSPKRSEKTVRLAAAQAKSLGAELVLLRILPAPEKVGVVAQLIASDRPLHKVTSQIDKMVEKLKAQGINASGVVKTAEVAKGIVETTKELKADLLFLGTSPIGQRRFFTLGTDPIARYVFNHCPISICLVRNDIELGTTGHELLGAEILDVSDLETSEKEQVSEEPEANELGEEKGDEQSSKSEESKA
jgi:nucleotide-binding universal stress UspA family protein